MVTDKKGRIFEDRRKDDIPIKKDRRKTAKNSKKSKSK